MLVLPKAAFTLLNEKYPSGRKKKKGKEKEKGS